MIDYTYNEYQDKGKATYNCTNCRGVRILASPNLFIIQKKYFLLYKEMSKKKPSAGIIQNKLNNLI